MYTGRKLFLNSKTSDREREHPAIGHTIRE